jgi:hypothetical protein
VDKPERLTLEELLKGEVQVSLINESVEEAKRESATAWAMRLWFRRDTRRLDAAERQAVEQKMRDEGRL